MCHFCQKPPQSYRYVAWKIHQRKIITAGNERKPRSSLSLSLIFKRWLLETLKRQQSKSVKLGAIWKLGGFLEVTHPQEATTLQLCVSLKDHICSASVACKTKGLLHEGLTEYPLQQCNFQTTGFNEGIK